MAKRDIPELNAQQRDKLGSRYARRLRDAGQLPAVVYGHKQTPVHIAIDRWSFEDMLYGGTHLLKVKIDSTSESCLIKDVQYDHLSLHPVHADLTRVDMSEEVEVELEIDLIGNPIGLSEEGAMLDHQLNSLLVKCRADSIPEKITHDISEMAASDVLNVGDLELPKGVTTDADPETLIAQIQIMQEEPEPELEEAAEGEEPAVIGQAEGEEEGEGETAEES